MKGEINMKFKVILEETVGFVSAENYFIRPKLDRFGSFDRGEPVVNLDLYLNVDFRKDEFYLGTIKVNQLAEYCNVHLQDKDTLDIFIECLTEFIGRECEDYTRVVESLNNKISDTRKEFKDYALPQMDVIRFQRRIREQELKSVINSGVFK